MASRLIDHTLVKAFGGCLGLIVAGCATIQNTPAQDRAWKAYEICRTETGSSAVIQRVDPDGRYYALCSDRCTRWGEFQRCREGGE